MSGAVMIKIGKIETQLHPIAVHFTNALFPVAVLFLALHLLSQQDSLRHTFFYILALATISSPISYLVGIVDCKERYKGVLTSIFLKKLRYGIALVIVGAVCVVWYYLYPMILGCASVARIIFLALNLSTLLFTVLLGHLGVKLIFGVLRNE
jgi:uncharacterized membrane protein